MYTWYIYVYIYIYLHIYIYISNLSMMWLHIYIPTSCPHSSPAGAELRSPDLRFVTESFIERLPYISYIPCKHFRFVRESSIYDLILEYIPTCTVLRLATWIVREKIINSWIDWFVRESSLHERFWSMHHHIQIWESRHQSFVRKSAIHELSGSWENRESMKDSGVYTPIYTFETHNRSLYTCQTLYHDRIVHKLAILSRTNRFMNWWFSHERLMSRVSNIYMTCMSDDQRWLKDAVKVWCIHYT